MSDNENFVRGPVMIAATHIIKTPGARIGKIGSNFSLPRTIPVKSVVGAGIGIMVGVLVGAVFGTFQSILGGALIMGFIGAVLVSWSPVRGETLLQYVSRRAAGRLRQKRLLYGDEHLAVYMGVARLPRTAAGPVRIRRGAVDVDAVQVDERGVIRSEANRNTREVLRPVAAYVPTFTPVYESDLPEAMRRETGSFSTVARRIVIDGAPFDATAVPAAPGREIRQPVLDGGAAVRTGTGRTGPGRPMSPAPNRAPQPVRPGSR